MLSDVFRFFTCVAVALTPFMRTYLGCVFRGETPCSLTTCLGMMVMISAGNFITLYMGLELQALSLYAMVAMHRTSKRASEAAMKYFVLGALASGMMLYGMSMIYGATGSLDLIRVAETILSGQSNRIILLFGLVFVVSGIGFKLGAVPYHMWVPDVYDGAPTAVTLLDRTAPKLAAFAFMLWPFPLALA
jgi:NADH-quinone oxidoreductase subunit N